MKRPSRLWFPLALGLFALAAGPVLAQDEAAEGSGTAPELDFLFFKEKVQPIFLEKRLGHARCIDCHDHRSPTLEPLAAGAATWNDQQSRKNFDMWKLFVTPGKPLESRMLLHPLAHEAGGDPFHAGGKHWATTAAPEWQTLADWVRGRRLGGLALPATSGTPYALQSNAAGDNIHIIDPATDQIVAMIHGVEVPHGLVASPDGKRIYVTNEMRQTLDVVDVRTLEVFKRIPLSGRPNNVDVANDGSKVYVGIREAPGAVDVIDAVALTHAKTVAVPGAIHNVYLTPDGSHVFAGSIESKTISVIDSTTDTLSWTMELDAGIRPMAFIKGGDGSTRSVIVQLSDFHGFAVLDFATRQITDRIAFPDPEGVEPEEGVLQGSPAHGLAVSLDSDGDPDIVWSTSKVYGSVYAYGIPQRCRPGYERPGQRCDWEFLARIEVGAHPDWLALTPDGKKLYVALAGDDETAVIDTAEMQVTGRIHVGNVPKRNIVSVLATQ